MCCQVEVSESGWSFVQRGPTECGLSNWVWSRNLQNEAAQARFGLLRHRKGKERKGKEKGTAIQLQAWTGPESSRRLRLPDSKQAAHEGGKVVSPTHRPRLPQEMFLVLISVRGWVDRRAIVWPEGLCRWIILMTPSRIEPETFWLAAQCASTNCATACPLLYR
jgi:hypothetical protein